MTETIIHDTDEGRWITVKGTHIHLEKGESVESGVKRALKRWKDPKKAAKELAEKRGKTELPLTKAQEKAKKEAMKGKKGELRTLSQYKERVRALKQALEHCRSHGGDFAFTPVIFREDSKTIGEWISCCMHKHGPKGDGTMTHKQCIAAAHQKFGKSKKDLIEDYPVQGHTRGGKPVKAHTRGESERKLGNYAKSQKYPGKIIRIVKGKVYIEYKPFSYQQGRGTAKAIRVSGVWIPKSQVWYDSFGKGGDIYVSEWFYPKLERKEAEAELSSLERQIESTEGEIAKLKENIKTPRSFTSEAPEKRITRLNESIKDEERYLKSFLEQREEIVKWVEEHPKQDFTEDLILIPIIIPFLRTDNVPFSEFTQLKTDFENQDFVIFHGPIVRDGPYDYKDENGNTETLFKEIDNLSDIYSRYKYLPIKASEEAGAHYAEELGYGTNFSLNKETNEIEADLVLVNDENFKDILRKKNEYHVSPGYNDIIKGNIQIITDVDHIALALGTEIGRACTGINSKGVSCTKVKKVNHDQNLTEVV